MASLGDRLGRVKRGVAANQHPGTQF